MVRLVLVCLVLVANVKGQFETCDTFTLPAHQDLNRERFMGSWYVLKMGTRLASEMTPSNWNCHESVISESGEENVLDFQDRVIVVENGTIIGPAVFDYKVHLGELSADNPNALWTIYRAGGTEVIGQSVVIASDESSWALEYVCFASENPVGKLSFWSRQRHLEPLVERTLHTMARSLGFPQENFIETEHSGC